MVDDALLDVLQEIGLTEYQSRAYVAAVQLGSTRFSALSDEADIPQQRIYDVVEDLEDLGLVEVHESSQGKEAVAIQPDTGLNELKNKRFEEFASNVDAAVESLEQQYERTDTSQGFLTVVNHESSVERHVRSAIDSADWWLFLSLPHDWYHELADDVRDAIDRGVTVRLVIQGEDRDALENIAYPEGIEVRYRASADLVVAADHDYGVFRAIAAPTVKRPSLVTWDETLVAYVEGHDTTTGDSGAWEGPVIDVVTEAGGRLDSPLGLPEVARLTIEVDGEPTTVGGWDATLEDVAASGIEIRQG